MRSLILASGSPRRREILEFFSYPFTQISSDFDENSIPFRNDPHEYVKELATQKAKAVSSTHPDSIVIGADTIVFQEGKILGKPTDEAHMKAMLNTLSGRRHSVYTGVACVSSTKVTSDVEKTDVLCNTLSPDDIHRYMRKHSLYDKAGSYAIQKSGALIVKEIHGCYYNVMGLPINTLQKLLLGHGIDLWDYLKQF